MDDDLCRFVSKTIRAKRITAGLNVEELAKLAGIQPNKLTEYETSSQGMSFSELMLIADALGGDALDFFEGYYIDGQSKPPDQTTIQ